MNNPVFEETRKTLIHNSSAVVVCIKSTLGSSPAKEGSKMLVCPDGKTFGTIGGGNLEYFCINRALEVYSSKKGFTEEFDLSEGNISMICGGKVLVEFCYISDSSALEEVFNVKIKVPRCVIFGGGHVGKEVCKIASYAGFEVILLDDRKEFCNKNIHPDASKCINCDYSDISSAIEIKKDDYVVIMTHGHLGDREVLLQICRVNPYYIGCIGSSKKVEATVEYLAENGISDSVICKIHLPIGLKIGGDTPQEIAISVVAEMIQQRYMEEK